VLNSFQTSGNSPGSQRYRRGFPGFGVSALPSLDASLVLIRFPILAFTTFAIAGRAARRLWADRARRVPAIVKRPR
jgi:hypothetical protein